MVSAKFDDRRDQIAVRPEKILLPAEILFYATLLPQICPRL
jgi:hypothetical protein